METKDNQTKKDIAGVRYDPEMNKYDNIILFPEKLAKAEESIKNSNLIEFLNKIQEESKEEKQIRDL